MVSGGDLANVFVYVKDGLGSRTFDVPKDPVVLDQSGCKYHPHVLGVMAGQTVQIKNDDMTTHNIHPTPKDNREWNESQPPQAPAIEKNFAREEIMLAPGETRPYKKTLAPETRFVGIVAAYRNLERATWRTIVPVQPGKAQRLTIRADSLAVSASMQP